MYKWGHSRRFNAFSNYCINNFGERYQKIAINAGFSCPNRDGTIGVEGCYYCNNSAFNPSYCDPEKSITEQISEGISFMTKRYKGAKKYLAYFQAYTNTHANTEQLKKKYTEALNFNGIVGIVVGTRPDCISEDILDFLERTSQNKFVSIEFGAESCYNKTLEIINRGHTFEDTVKALEMTARRNIHTGIHLIFGLPGESKEQILLQTEILANLPFNSLKIHQLQIVKDTVMEEMYRKAPGNFCSFSLDEYIDFAISFVEKIRPEIIVERFAGEVPPRFMAGPTIMKHKEAGYIRNDQILQMIEKRMAEKDTWQGKYYE